MAVTTKGDQTRRGEKHRAHCPPTDEEVPLGSSAYCAERWISDSPMSTAFMPMGE